MHNCWAYYPGPGKSRERPEPLREHLVNVAIGIMTHMDFHRIIKKISREYGIDDKDIHDIGFLVGLLHDIGKALKKYQEPPGPHFPGHEVYSAFIIHSALINAGLNNPDNETVKRLILYPILLHHYAQRDSVEEIYMKVMYEVLNRNNPIAELHDECLNDVTNILEYAMNIVRSEFAMQLIKTLQDDTHDGKLNLAALDNDPFNPLKIIVKIEEWFGVMALTGLLNEVDGKVAMRARRGRA
mgnify:FL=1